MLKKTLLILLGLSIIGSSLFAGGRNQSGGVSSSGKIPITVGMWELSQVGGDAVGDFIENKFNIDIQPVLQEWGDYQEMFRLWAASNQLPDTFSGYPMTESWFGEFVREGLLRSIPYAMISKYPNLKKVVDGHSLTQLAKTKLGDYYFIPRPQSAKGYIIGQAVGIYYRKDWAEKLGFRDPIKDMDTFYNMLRAFTNNDPDGDGRKNTYGFTATTTDFFVLFEFFNAFPYQWINGPGGRAIPGYLDEGPMIEALTWLRKAYTEGLIDPEFPRDPTIVASKFAQNTFGAMGRNVNAYWVNRHVMEQFGGSHPGIDSLKAVGHIGAMSPKAGGKAYHVPDIDSSGIVFNADLSDEKLDKLLALYDWLISDEGNALRYWGIKDVDYRVNGDGTLTKITSDDLRTKYPSIFIFHVPGLKPPPLGGQL
jgi:ABC-type glycerol-3-phosphate transport system substrate-binding protein